MPQELNVLCCYSCKMFQVHIVKKARKWQCKVCNAKQSIQQIYFQGSGQQCRLHVQKLNAAKANFALCFTTDQNDKSDSCDTSTRIPDETGKHTIVENKWEKYLDTSEKEKLSDTEDPCCGDISDNATNMPREKSLYNENNDALCLNNFEDTVDESSCEFEDSEVKETNKMYPSYNSNINCNFEDNSRSTIDYNTATNIFETYSELDENNDISKKLCTNTISDSCSSNFEDTDRSNCEREDVTYKTKKLWTSDEKCKLQDKNKSNTECINVADIFETYGDLDESPKF